MSSVPTILILIISTATLIISILNLVKQNKKNESYKYENYKNITKLTSDTSCISGCQPSSFLGGLIKNFIPIPLKIGENELIEITINKKDGKGNDVDIVYPYARNGCTVTKGTVIVQCYCSISIKDIDFIASIVPFKGITSINIQNFPISVEMFINCSNYKIDINRILCDISYNDNLETIGNITSDGSIDQNTINSINSLINSILYNNSHIFNFDVPTCSYNLETCNGKDGTNPNIPSCTALTNTLNNFIEKNLKTKPYSFSIPSDYTTIVNNLLCTLN